MTHWTRRDWLGAALSAAALQAAQGQELPVAHPRVMITPEMVREMAAKARGAFAAEYRTMLETARLGPRGMETQWGVPAALMEAGLAWLIERELGRDGNPYAEKVLEMWRQPAFQKPGLARHFGWQGLVYDWIYDAMSAEPSARSTASCSANGWRRGGRRCGQHPALGLVVQPALGSGALDEPNNRVALLAKLFMSAR